MKPKYTIPSGLDTLDARLLRREQIAKRPFRCALPRKQQRLLGLMPPVGSIVMNQRW